MSYNDKSLLSRPFVTTRASIGSTDGVHDESRNSSTSSTMRQYLDVSTGSESRGSEFDTAYYGKMKHVAALYKSITGQDMPNAELRETLNVLEREKEARKEEINETKLAEKLKLHLIHQGKHMEAQGFNKLYQTLKESSVMKHRGPFLALMYELFDKQPTRDALEKKKGSKVMGLSRVPSANAGLSGLSKLPTADKNSHQNPIRTETSRYRNGGTVPQTQTGSEPHRSNGSTCIATKSNTVAVAVAAASVEGPSSPSPGDWGRPPPAQAQRKDRIAHSTPFPGKGSFFPDSGEFDATAMPRLNYTQDTHIKMEVNKGHRQLSSIVDPAVSQQAYQERAFPSLPQDNVRSLPSMNHHNDRILSNVQDRRGRLDATANSHLMSASVNQYTGKGKRPFANTRALGKELIKDLVFVFKGVDGIKIKCPNDIYEIVTRESLHPGLRNKVLRLCEIGFLFRKVQGFCEKPSTGLMVQGLKRAIEQEVVEFYRQIAIVQAQIQQSNTLCVDTPISERPDPELEMSMLKLSVWMFDSQSRLEVLKSMVDAVEGKKGGEMCSVLHQFLQHGDPTVTEQAHTVLSLVTKPLFVMICQWILFGELDDPFNEFFIGSDEGDNDQLWHAKFIIRKKMLPTFTPEPLAEKIMGTGKNINFLKDVCQHSRAYDGRAQIKSILEQSHVDCLFMGEDYRQVLEMSIDKAYKTTSDMVLKVVLEECKLMDHMKAIKNYLLLGQGDFIQHLLTLIQDELSKPADKLYSHNIQSILESAIRATNAQFENKDVLNRLDFRILPGSDKDLGWDVFCLDYKVHGPIGTVLSDDVMTRYNKLFNSLWRTKRIEGILSKLWNDQLLLYKYQRVLPEINPVLHRCQLLISEMIHFTHQTQYYIMFEATECAWEDVMKDIKAAKDLDKVIAAHNKFLDTITSRILLEQDKRDLLNQLRGIFDIVYELQIFLVKFTQQVITEYQNRKASNCDDQQSQKKFFASSLMKAKGQIESYYTTTQDLVRSFLIVLNKQHDLTLQCLSFRLDFNQYYQNKDSRLSQTLTFQHRRLSSHSHNTRSATSILENSQFMNVSQQFSLSGCPEEQ